ncbi:MAG TPA: hypothetical protein DIW47_12870 [Bacteroidetes bacterium]|nr:hypothetical protein [Bacteroidota bacterium]
MARKNNLDESLPFIEEFFDNSLYKSFTDRKFSLLLDQNRPEWRIVPSKSFKQVLKYLLAKNLFLENIVHDNDGRPKSIYSWKTENEYSIAMGLKSNSYVAYYSAAFIHGLTLQIPKTLYINHEHTASSASSNSRGSLIQSAIDGAFAKPQRKSAEEYTFQDWRIILTNGMFTNRLGVIQSPEHGDGIHLTDLERTLLDISVRPAYSGGVFEVLEAYKRADDKLDVEKLKRYLTTLNYLYPYHQVIGFYLDRAGYSDHYTNLFHYDLEHDFYLTYNMKLKEYSEKWKLFYPKGM